MHRISHTTAAYHRREQRKRDTQKRGASNKSLDDIAMATASEDKPKISELKDKVCGTTDVGKQADECSKTAKAIGEYVGRVCGHEMKKLVLQLEESEPEEPEHPQTTADKDKAIWSKEHDMRLKKLERREDQKSKVFTIVVGQCSKPMKNRVESSSGFVEAEKASDVVKLLRTIEDIAFDCRCFHCILIRSAASSMIGMMAMMRQKSPWHKRMARRRPSAGIVERRDMSRRTAPSCNSSQAMHQMCKFHIGQVEPVIKHAARILNWDDASKVNDEIPCGGRCAH